MIINLPTPALENSHSLTWAIENRRSCREYEDLPVPLAALSLLLWAAQGKTDEHGRTATPSAGGQYPIHIFVAPAQGENVAGGAFRYVAQDHVLQQVDQNDIREQLCDSALDRQPWVQQAGAVFILAADFDAMRHHFFGQPPQGRRGDRYIFIETGAMVENIQLQATACGLGAVLVGGFDDDEVARILSLGEGIRPTAMICIGHPSAAMGNL